MRQKNLLFLFVRFYKKIFHMEVLSSMNPDRCIHTHTQNIYIYIYIYNKRIFDDHKSRRQAGIQK
jgi:hypothetical protein